MLGGVPYATPQDMLAAWPKVHTSGLQHDELRTMLDRASHLIDGMLARRYTVPFCADPSDAPPLVRDICVDLAMLDVLDRAPNTPDWIVRRIERAQHRLDRLAAGDAALVGPDGGLVGELTDVGVLTPNTSGYVPVFGAVPSSLTERADPARAADEASARGAVLDE